MEDVLKFDAVKAVSAAMDSVNLINTLKAKESLSDEDYVLLLKNQKHLKIMLAKPEFVSALLDNQKSLVNSAVL